MFVECSCLRNVAEETIRLYLFIFHKMRFWLWEDNRFVMLVELLIVFKSSRMPHVCGLVLIFTFFYVFSPMINSLRCSQVFFITFEEAFFLFALAIFLQNSRLFFNRFRCKGFIEDSVSKFSKWRCPSVYSQTIFLHLRLEFWTWR